MKTAEEMIFVKIEEEITKVEDGQEIDIFVREEVHTIEHKI